MNKPCSECFYKAGPYCRNKLFATITYDPVDGELWTPAGIRRARERCIGDSFKPRYSQYNLLRKVPQDIWDGLFGIVVLGGIGFLFLVLPFME